MSWTVTPVSSRQLGEMSRGTARSIRSSGRPARSAMTSESASRSITLWGEEVEETTMSAAASSDGSSSKRTALPPKRWAMPIARS